MRRVEALADAIAAHNGSSDPEHLFYKLRNPGGLKKFIERHRAEFSGYRSFRSHADGYRALVHDLECKIDGKSTFGVGPGSQLFKVLPLFDVSLMDKDSVVLFVRKALNLEQIDENISLGFFQE